MTSFFLLLSSFIVFIVSFSFSVFLSLSVFSCLLSVFLPFLVCIKITFFFFKFFLSFQRKGRRNRNRRKNQTRNQTKKQIQTTHTTATASPLFILQQPLISFSFFTPLFFNHTSSSLGFFFFLPAPGNLSREAD